MVNDHQRDLDAHNDPCAFRISNTDWTLRRIAFPSSAILDCSEILSITSYVRFNLVLNKSSFTRSRDIHPRDLVTRCATLWMESHRVGPEYLSIIWIDKSRSCNNTPQHISMEYLRYYHYDPHISVRWWDVSQSIREDSDYARTHGQRNGLLRSVIATLKFHKVHHVAMLTLGNVH